MRLSHLPQLIRSGVRNDRFSGVILVQISYQFVPPGVLADGCSLSKVENHFFMAFTTQGRVIESGFLLSKMEPFSDRQKADSPYNSE